MELSSESRKILEDLADRLRQELAEELIGQGHKNTGTLLESIRVAVVEEAFGTSIEGSTLDYGVYLNGGRKPGGKRIPISALIQWVEQRGIANEEEEIESIAYAIQTKIFQEGSPTFGSFKYSNNGRRKEWIEYVLENNEKEITEAVTDAFGNEVEVLLANIIKGVDKRIK